MVGRLCVLLASTLLLGCGGSAFACQDDAQCVGTGGPGLCQASGHCSFPDAECPSGQRYGEHSGTLAGDCVPVMDGSGDVGDGGDAGESGPTGTGASPSTSESSGAPGTTTVALTSGPISDSSGPPPGDGSTTGQVGTGTETSATTTGPSPDTCDSYCDAAAPCFRNGFGACGQTCDDGLDYAEEHASGACKDALEELLECEAGLTCEELQSLPEAPRGTECSDQMVVAVQLCPVDGCISLCEAFEMCAVGGPTSCLEGCTGYVLQSGFQPGGIACFEASDAFYACLASVDCATLEAMFEGMGEPPPECAMEAMSLFGACPN